MTSNKHQLEDSSDPFLSAYLEPFRRWLDDGEVTELLVNRPGEVWIERPAGMERHLAEVVDDRLLRA